MSHLFCAIDVGITHLGICWCFTNDDFSFECIEDFALVDLTSIRHDRINFENCKLRHTNCMADRVDHFIQEYDKILYYSENIFVE